MDAIMTVERLLQKSRRRSTRSSKFCDGSKKNPEIREGLRGRS
jgi:hypothetical protein